jgi:hypothetical protein
MVRNPFFKPTEIPTSLASEAKKIFSSRRELCLQCVDKMPQSGDVDINSIPTDSR